MLNADDVTVSAVYPQQPGAVAGLMAGDVIVRIGDAHAVDLDRGHALSVANAEWGQPLELTVRRGMPQPYSSHPRLDLFLGSLSPHPMGKFGCTICHQGQGSATSFEWASHTPEFAGAGRGMGPRIWLVSQPSLDFPDVSGAVRANRAA